MEASTPSMERPLKIGFMTENQDYSYVTMLKNENNGEKMVIKWQLGTFPEGGVKTWDIAFDMKAFRDVLNAVSTMVGVRSGPLIHSSGFDNERSTYRSHYIRAAPDTHSFKVDSPSRTFEAEAIYSPSRAGIKVYPNRVISEDKYEVVGEYRKNHWSGNSAFEGRLSHPFLARDMRAVVEYTSSSDRRQGSFELDIFPDAADKITGVLISNTVANNTFVVETNLSTRVSVIKLHC